MDEDCQVLMSDSERVTPNEWHSERDILNEPDTRYMHASDTGRIKSTEIERMTISLVFSFLLLFRSSGL